MWKKNGARLFLRGVQGMEEGQQAESEIQEIPLNIKKKKSCFMVRVIKDSEVVHVLGDAQNPGGK